MAGLYWLTFRACIGTVPIESGKGSSMPKLVAAVLSVCLLAGSFRPASASDLAVEGPDQQAPQIVPFRSAHFGLAGTVKVDGITVDILGEGDLIPPDRQRSSFKFGPFTVEVALFGDNVYTRSRFDRNWSQQVVPQPVAVGSLSGSELLAGRSAVRSVGAETVSGVLTEHYAVSLDFQAVVERLLPLATDADTRRALQTLEGSVDVWIGAQDRMIRQERFVLSLVLPSIEPDGDPSPAAVDLTIAYTRLNEAVTIESPVGRDTSPLRSPQPGVTPVTGPPGSPAVTGTRPGPPGRAPAQIPGR